MRRFSSYDLNTPLSSKLFMAFFPSTLHRQDFIVLRDGAINQSMKSCHDRTTQKRGNCCEYVSMKCYFSPIQI